MTMRPTTHSERLLFISFLLCACVLLLMPHHVTTKLQLAFSTVFQLPLGTGRMLALAAQTPTSGQGNTPDDYDSLKRENVQLQNHVHTLRALLAQEREEKAKLTKISLLPAWGSQGLVPARVIQEVAGADEVIINRGKRHGLLNGQYMMADEAIAGTIGETGRYQARGVLITDASSHIPVYIESAQSKPKGVLSGLGNGLAKIEQIPIQYKIEIGDLVHIQTTAGLIEWPVVVGKVSACRRNETQPLVWDILVEPLSKHKDINQVHVIVAHK